MVTWIGSLRDICNEVKVEEPEKSKRNLKYIIKDWLNMPVTRFDALRTWLILGQITFDIAIIIKARKRK